MLEEAVLGVPCGVGMVVVMSERVYAALGGWKHSLTPPSECGVYDAICTLHTSDLLLLLFLLPATVAAIAK